VNTPSESRYARLELIDWWDGALVRRARAVVAGAGALGNEVAKNLLLLGWGTVVVVDVDRVEPSNLSRSVLHGIDDIGAPKATALARNAGRVNPDVTFFGLDGDLRTALSPGLLSRVDVVLGCVDNLAARVALGQLAGRAGCLYIDGGISTWEGTVRLYDPVDGPCYACGLTADDVRQLALRRSCLVYQRRAAAQHGVATTPTVASVTGALMVQQALKWLHRDRHRLPVPVGRELRVDAAYDRFWSTELQRNEACLVHPERLDPVRDPAFAWDRPWRDILAACREWVGAPDADVHLPVTVLERWTCARCHATGEAHRAYAGDTPLTCTTCDGDAIPDLTNVLTGTEAWAARSPAAMGFPPWTWIEIREKQAFELAGAPPELAQLADREAVEPR
jgi:molybdopterin/thiamine biosynthesis adenylyltransferase